MAIGKGITADNRLTLIRMARKALVGTLGQRTYFCLRLTTCEPYRFTVGTDVEESTCLRWPGMDQAFQHGVQECFDALMLFCTQEPGQKLALTLTDTDERHRVTSINSSHPSLAQYTPRHQSSRPDRWADADPQAVSGSSHCSHCRSSHATDR